MSGQSVLRKSKLQGIDFRFRGNDEQKSSFVRHSREGGNPGS